MQIKECTVMAEEYAVAVYRYSHFLILPKADGVHIILHDRANARDIIQVRKREAGRAARSLVSNRGQEGQVVC